MGADNIRVAISGATGRMGRQLIQSLLLKSNCYKSVVFTAAITNSNSKFIGSDVGRLIDGRSVGIVIHDSIEDIYKDFDILIDFSSSQATLNYLKSCNMYNKNMVIGTTGFTEEEFVFIKKTSQKIGIVFSPNFSIMVNVMLKLLEKATSIIGGMSDIKIIELHHRNKKDIPSGTALKIRQSILSVLFGSDNKKVRNMFSKMNNDYDIDIHSMRAGGFVGEHNVLFANDGESLEVIHRGFDRSIFASGAIYSALWLGVLKVGLFDMVNVLGLDEI
ncbi:4-hydroxy-tetrahydrodipicolinate reductase [Blochmannia endosymbiont of Polyrhachis (Hedomyrma) turneri]|uniref:4-hydroxy-tetrahydrodipicolinate reductase n=1 Tax=Blochmannia endosymbiont of Polyrhachis (Hedomyrma) turneri TaxID=1505596 RepID=UPI00061A64C3|nr:4-hydroxy-tetrahydrodipicolinate reductase [Blochmannia endosymbiont of Polyrhachis (Hedomyrma) turneri]AKC59704.1 Dihydrodipicolinate reductase [Blochmannia endosymbiont of Polyrhachis (Hedomyrma) turneri]